MDQAAQDSIRSDLKRALSYLAVAVLGVLIIGLVSNAIRTRSDDNQAQQPEPVASPATPVSPAALRSTINITLTELIDRYNAFATAGIGASFMLPATLAETARNPVFHAYEHMFSSPTMINIEVENNTGRPFSLNVAGSPQNATQHAEMMAVMGAVGATIFGKGDDAGAILRECVEAVKSETKTHSTVINGFKVYCSNLGELGWMSGISLIDTHAK